MFPPASCNKHWIDLSIDAVESLIPALQFWIKNQDNQSSLFTFPELEALNGSIDYTNANHLLSNLEQLLDHLEIDASIGFWIEGYYNQKQDSCVSVNISVHS